MIRVTTFAGKQVAVFGLGESGLATATALQAGGAEVVAFDDVAERRAQAAANGFRVDDLRNANWCAITALILAPGVPLTHPQPHWSVDLAHQAGVEIIGDLELFCRERRRQSPSTPFIAITGTNGKSTTTALVAHLLRWAGREVAMGGNIGTPMLALEPFNGARHYVVECSSYQIDLAPSLDPSIGVLLNLSPDHLDRHGDMDNYTAIKERLISASSMAVVCAEDPRSAAVSDRREQAGGPVLRVSGDHPVTDGVEYRGTRLIRRNEGSEGVFADLNGMAALRGRHNAQNAATGAAVMLALGIGEQEIAAGLASFPGLVHRLEPVAHRGRVMFINDSKATNAAATLHALAAFDPIYWIAGGLAKEDGIAPLASLFPRIARAYLIGEAAEGFAQALNGKVPWTMCDDLQAAVTLAALDAAHDNAPEVAVLLSPACASFDQFDNFASRGEAFRSAVLALDGIQQRKECA